MSYFNEDNTVEQLMLDTLTDKDSQWCVAEPQADCLDSPFTIQTSNFTLQTSNFKWRFVSAEELPDWADDLFCRTQKGIKNGERSV